METLEMTAKAKDPVCGMHVNPETARAAGLTAEHGGEEFYFCGRGCRLEFLDDPKRFFNPDYVPSM
jgi:Cu+-exporting ATPase